jgi:putative component of membrane protein insertase Oxa1/YidC/SpoIIIJ protein YidD
MKKILMFCIEVYQTFLREVLAVLGFGSDCCFTPTCSDYTKEAISKYGAIKGSFMGFKRVSRCFFCKEHKHDPLP